MMFGRLFYIGFMENSRWKPNIPCSTTILMGNFGSCTANASVTTPLFNAAYKQEVTIGAGAVVTLTMPDELQDAKEDRGIVVIATDNINVFLSNGDRFSNDAYTGRPADKLGRHYIVTTWKTSSQILVVGVRNETDVSLKFPVSMTTNVTFDGVAYNPGDTFNFTLNEFETRQIYSTDDLTGVEIITDQLVGVMCGNRKTKLEFGARDHMIEQMVPVDRLGTEHITVGTPMNQGEDIFRVTSTVVGTVLTINGIQTNVFSTVGEFEDYRFLSGQYNFMNATEPVQVAMFSQCRSMSVCDPAMGMLTPIKHFSRNHLYKPPLDNATNHVVIVSKKDYSAGFFIDGAPVCVLWTPVTYASEYVATKIEVNSSTHVIINSNPVATFATYAFGARDRTSYLLTLK